MNLTNSLSCCSRAARGVTLDPERDRAATCIGCGNAGPNELIHVGQYRTGFDAQLTRPASSAS